MQPIPRYVRPRTLFRQACLVFVFSLISFQVLAQSYGYRQVKECTSTANAVATFSPALTHRPIILGEFEGEVPLQACTGDSNAPTPKSIVFTGTVPLMACDSLFEGNPAPNAITTGAITWSDDSLGQSSVLITTVRTSFSNTTSTAMQLVGTTSAPAALHRIQIDYDHPGNSALCSTSGISWVSVSAKVILSEPCLPGTERCQLLSILP